MCYGYTTLCAYIIVLLQLNMCILRQTRGDRGWVGQSIKRHRGLSVSASARIWCAHTHTYKCIIHWSIYVCVCVCVFTCALLNTWGCLIMKYQLEKELLCNKIWPCRVTSSRRTYDHCKATQPLPSRQIVSFRIYFCFFLLAPHYNKNHTPFCYGVNAVVVR